MLGNPKDGAQWLLAADSESDPESRGCPGFGVGLVSVLERRRFPLGQPASVDVLIDRPSAVCRVRSNRRSRPSLHTPSHPGLVGQLRSSRQPSAHALTGVPRPRSIYHGIARMHRFRTQYSNCIRLIGSKSRMPARSIVERLCRVTVVSTAAPPWSSCRRCGQVAADARHRLTDRSAFTYTFPPYAASPALDRSHRRFRSFGTPAP